jgi:hypothetical protein
MLKENDKKTSWLVKAMVLPFTSFSLLSGREKRGKKLLQLSQILIISGAIATGGCGCTVRGPITGTNYQIEAYKYGVELQGDFLKIKVGTQEK